MQTFIPGQRWISEAELQMGLGTILDSDQRTVTVLFMATGETRTYARQSAPLRRVRFSPGDSIQSHEGWSVTVTKVHEHEGQISYTGHREDNSTVTINESDLDSFTRLNQPLQRILNAQIDSNKLFELRARTHACKSDRYHSELYGLTGGRTSLIPHQLYIAHEVANRFAPRVLLADEVGLGKTIEAGLILHHQLITERAQRVLVIVPESLVHQWLVEMLRRFNLQFSILDEKRCQAIEESSGFENPFHAQQLVICTIGFMTGSPERLTQALDGNWDLLVVDEAHHLRWSEQSASPEYLCIEQLSQSIAGVLLLTATPEQLGKSSHFARLRLLDPDRFSSLQSFMEEEAHYEPVAQAIDKLVGNEQLELDSLAVLRQSVTDQDSQGLLDQIISNEQAGRDTSSLRQALIDQLLDRHGTGRILFRNTRSSISGFPARHLQAAALPAPGAYEGCIRELQSLGLSETQLLLCPELLYESSTDSRRHWTDIDPRTDWLLEKLLELRPDKVLVIAASAETALDLSELLRKKSRITTSVFHEGMSLMERDRAAAWFADQEYGCQVLICSEIGSEGRNFQFAHHMVLFDLPLNPDLLEQRIGRLDRIGQASDINIHVPYLQGTPQEILFRWYHEGLNAFEKTCHTGFSIYSRLEATLRESLHQLESGPGDINALIETTRKLNSELNEALHRGRDRLLEINSCRPDLANRLTEMALDEDRDSQLPDYLEMLFDAFGIDSEPHTGNSLVIRPGEQMQAGALPGLGDDGMTITCDRETALSNEDMQYISWQHPMISNAMETILGNETGNTAMITIKNPALKPGMLLLECLFILEPPASISLQTTRYLPPVRLRIVIDNNGHFHEDSLTADSIRSSAENLPGETSAKVIHAYSKMTRELTVNAESRAQQQVPDIIRHAHEQAIHAIQTEAERLRSLAAVNPNIREDEILYYEDLQQRIVEAIDHTRLRLDAQRLIITT